MMKLKVVLLSFIFLSTLPVVSGQQICNLNIVTQPGNLVAPFKFNFTVNGDAYKLKAGHCLQVKVNADSVHILMRDNRWVKNETIDVHTAAEKDLYVLIRLAKNKEIMKGEFYIAETICKECFEELKKRCTKELSGK
jgi:hypothetical protein